MSAAGVLSLFLLCACVAPAARAADRHDALRGILPSGPVPLGPSAEPAAGVPGIGRIVAFSPKPAAPRVWPLLHIPPLYSFLVQLSGALPRRYNTATAERLATLAHRYNAGAFQEQCYAYASWYLQLAGIVTSSRWTSMGIPTKSAADFAAWAARNPHDLDEELALRRVPTPAAAGEIPVGSLVVFERGLCGYSRRHGHIGIVTDPGRLCADGCERFRPGCLKTRKDRSKVHVFVPVR